jgi:hypothetical protein
MRSLQQPAMRADATLALAHAPMASAPSFACATGVVVSKRIAIVAEKER